MILHDAKDALLGVIRGNFACQTIKMRIFPDFAISLSDQNIELGLTMYHKIERLKMPPGSKVCSITACMVYAYSTKHHITTKKFKEENINIAKPFSDICEVIPPRELKHEELDFPQELIL